VRAKTQATVGIKFQKRVTPGAIAVKIKVIKLTIS
jgi:hypothetical protein